jgi:phytoene/squalene synthetase
VGRIVLGLEGCREEPLLELSDAICTGLQLVNFWQDVKRDRVAGRVYLPQADMNRFGVTETMLDGDRGPPELRALVRYEVGWARACFAQGAPLVTLAPRVLRPAIRMFVGGGNALADSIERAGFNTLSRRPTVNRWQKARLAAGAWWGMAANAMLGYS